MKKGNIFWGVALLTIGVLFALRNFDIFFFNWHAIFRLWPLIFIFWGIAILPVKSFVKLVLTLLTIVLAIIFLANAPRNTSHWFEWWPDRHSYRYDKDYDSDYEREDDYDWEEQYSSETFDSTSTYAELNIDAIAGKFYIDNTSTELFEFKSEGDAGPYEVETSEWENSTTVDINLKRKSISTDDFTNNVWISLNIKPIWTMNIDVGAASLELDTSPFRVENIDIDGGASKIEMKLGDKYNKTNVSIDAGASSIVIKVPYESAVELETSTFLSSRNIDGFNKIKSGLYQTSNFSDSANQIFIEIDAAVSSFRIDRY